MESPRDAVDDTMRRLAARLTDIGFEAKPGLKIARKIGDATQEIRAQPARGNRAGETVQFSLDAMLHSAAVKRWTKAQIDPVLHAEGPFAGVVATRQLRFAEGIAGHRFDVVLPEDRDTVADRVADVVREDWLDWFAQMGDPSRALDALGWDNGNMTWPLRFALAHGMDAEARDALARYCQSFPEFGREFAQHAAQIIAEGQPSGWQSGTEELAGFAVAAGIAF